MPRIKTSFAALGRCLGAVWPIVLSSMIVAACGSSNESREARVGPEGESSGQSGRTGGSGSVSGSNDHGATGTSGGAGSDIVIEVRDAGRPSDKEDAGCGFADFSLERKPAEIFLVMDRSGSMDNTDAVASDGTEVRRWDILQPAIVSVIESTNDQLGWGLKTFPEGDDENCLVTSKIDRPIEPSSAPAMVQAIQATEPTGDGTPTAAAIREAVTYLSSRTTDNPKFILLATDGEPSCKDSDDAKIEAVAAVKAAAEEGIPTFVVGISIKASSNVTLNLMAQAGGRPAKPLPATYDPKADTGAYYYAASSATELSSALTNITTSVISCTFPLKAKPPAPDFVDVNVNGKSIDRDDVNGWQYDGEALDSLSLHGTACEAIKKGGDVHIVFGCPGVRPPVLR